MFELEFAHGFCHTRKLNMHGYPNFQGGARLKQVEGKCPPPPPQMKPWAQNSHSSCYYILCSLVIYIATKHRTCDSFTAHLIGSRSCDTHNLAQKSVQSSSPVQQSSPAIRDDLMGRMGRPSNRSVHSRLQTTNI